MTFEEACELLGYAEPPEVGPLTRESLVAFVQEETADGTKPMDPQVANRTRAEVETFG